MRGEMKNVREKGDKEESSIFKSSFSFSLLVLFIVYNLFYIIDVL